jgi:hypothetical protein
VLNTSVFEFPTGRGVLAACETLPFELQDDFPAVPALPETLLALELQLQERSVDLQQVSEVILGDLGAAIQVLRLAGQEYGDSEDRPLRIEDCISDLGLQACLEAAASGVLARGFRHHGVFEIWSHSREIAQYCRLLAEEMPGVLTPHEAGLAGLLHEMDALPAALGWNRSEFTAGRNFSASALATKWSFPGFLKHFFSEIEMPRRNSHWQRMLAAAHHLAMESPANCALRDLHSRSLLATRTRFSC